MESKGFKFQAEWNQFNQIMFEPDTIIFKYV